MIFNVLFISNYFVILYVCCHTHNNNHIPYVVVGVGDFLALCRIFDSLSIDIFSKLFLFAKNKVLIMDDLYIRALQRIKGFVNSYL